MLLAPEVRQLAPLPPPVSASFFHVESVERDAARKSVRSRSTMRKNRSTVHLGALVDERHNSVPSSASNSPSQGFQLPSGPLRGGRTTLCASLPSLGGGRYRESLRRLKESQASQTGVGARKATSPDLQHEGVFGKVVEDDVSPSMHLLQELKQIAVQTRETRPKPEPEEEEEQPSPEHTSWMSSTLASIPSKKRGLLPPLEVKRLSADSSSQKESIQSRPSSQPETSARPTPEPFRDLPPWSEVLERLTRVHDGFTRPEIARMTAVFNHFTLYNNEIYKDDLRIMMQLLGYMLTDEESIHEVVVKVTSSNRLNLKDFVAFGEKLTVHERQKLRELFNNFDEDKNGRLSVKELKRFLMIMGFTPLRTMIREALQLVRADKSDSLGFKELLHLLVIYRHTEGFTQKELKALQLLFMKDPRVPPGELPSHQITNLLQQFYKPQAAWLSKHMGVEVSRSEMPQDRTAILGLKIPETLLWARSLREQEIKVYRDKFALADKDRNHTIDFQELHRLLEEMGYTLTNATVVEAMREAEDIYPEKREGQLDFDEFVTLLLILRARDGFSRAEVRELKTTFERFDIDGKNEVDITGFSDILRYMGFKSVDDDLQPLIAEADLDSNGSLNFREFLWLMRLYRESELQKLRAVFEHLEDRQHHNIRTAVVNLGYNFEDEVELWLHKKVIAEFDHFVELIDKCRTIEASSRHRCAGFHEEELKHFRELFTRYDSGETGSINLFDTGSLIAELGFTLQTVQDRQHFLRSLSKAREAAQVVGIPEVGDAESPLTFWVLVQLLRALYSPADDQQLPDREAKAIEQTKFGQTEVTDFRQIFLGCSADDRGQPSDPRCSTKAHDLSSEAVRRLLHDLNVQLDMDSRQRLDDKIDELNPAGRVDFADFLRLMRWMLDTNFADIEGSVAKVLRHGNHH